jgi:hypothetical protein
MLLPHHWMRWHYTQQVLDRGGSIMVALMSTNFFTKNAVVWVLVI